MRGQYELPGFVSMAHLQPGRVQWLEYLRCPNFVTHIRSLNSKNKFYYRALLYMQYCVI